MRDSVDVFGVFTVGLIFGALSLMVTEMAVGMTYEDGIEDTRMEALNAGVAEWPRNGEFKWKEATCQGQ